MSRLACRAREHQRQPDVRPLHPFCHNVTVRRIILPPALLLALLSGCAQPSDGTGGVWGSTAAPTGTPDGDPSTAYGTFLPYTPQATAITYDPTVVPAGATADVVITMTGAGVAVTLTVTGMVPRRAYGAHLHTAPCAAAPEQAGPHYQHSRDPRAPSVDPSYANPRNEVWLDFTADASGRAKAVATQAWGFGAAVPRSLVIHTRQTQTAPGTAGTAGPRAACLTVPG